MGVPGAHILCTYIADLSFISTSLFFPKVVHLFPSMKIHPFNRAKAKSNFNWSLTFFSTIAHTFLQGRPDHTSGGAAAPPVKGWVHPPRKGCPPQKKEEEVNKGKKKKGRQKGRKKERTQEKRCTIKDRGLRCRGSSL